MYNVPPQQPQQPVPHLLPNQEFARPFRTEHLAEAAAVGAAVYAVQRLRGNRPSALHLVAFKVGRWLDRRARGGSSYDETEPT